MKQSITLLKAAQGVSLVSVVLYACLVGMTIFTGVYLWVNKQGSTTSSAARPTMTTYTDTAGYFRLQYPAAWHLISGQNYSEGLNPDWAKVSRPIMIIPPYAPDPSAGLSVLAFSPDQAKNMWQGWYGSRFDTITQTAIDGRSAYHDKLNFVGPSSVEAYTDDNYLVLNGDQSLWLSFRENYRHDFPREAWTNHDITSLEMIVSSIKILR